MDDLKDHYARVEFARGEISTIQDAVEAYLAGEPLEIYSHLDFHPTNPKRVYRSRLRAELPKGVVIRTGTTINELRSVLDSLACTLARRNGATDVRKVYFPTGKSEDVFQAELRRKAAALSESDRAALANLKPYPGGDDLLYAMHSSDLIRKHERLIVLASAPGVTVLGEDGRSWTLDSSKFEWIKAGAGTPVGDIIARCDLDAELPIRYQAKVAFAEPEALSGKPVVEGLTEFAGIVTAALDRFNQT